ncbi:MAG: non-hydrolyzing UDP-N-acetylglucosamine 2-epimerase [Pyrinomonadaceae bacterium]
MKVLTIFGTRPEIIRLSIIVKLLDAKCEHVTVHTGQNFHENLSKVFFDELNIRAPDHELDIKGRSFGEQVGQLFSRIENIFDTVNPDRVLILGDTNSALSAIIAARRRIPVFHMEAGNRCYDDRVPEEVNRRIIDHSSSILLPYTERSKENLVREGIERERIFVTGNPIFEVLEYYRENIDTNTILSELSLQPKSYFLATIHRAENVDNGEKLRSIFQAFENISTEFKMPMLVSVHPRTAEKLSKYGITIDQEKIRLIDAMPFFAFVNLENNAFMVLTDSGTVQEECAIFGVANVTVRDVTERPETIECGSNIIGGCTVDSIISSARIAASNSGSWNAPDEYLQANVSQTVCNIVLGHLSRREHH